MVCFDEGDLVSCDTCKPWTERGFLVACALVAAAHVNLIEQYCLVCG